jgi:hypothetical protein
MYYLKVKRQTSLSGQIFNSFAPMFKKMPQSPYTFYMPLTYTV